MRLKRCASCVLDGKCDIGVSSVVLAQAAGTVSWLGLFTRRYCQCRYRCVGSYDSGGARASGRLGFLWRPNTGVAGA